MSNNQIEENNMPLIFPVPVLSSRGRWDSLEEVNMELYKILSEIKIKDWLREFQYKNSQIINHWISPYDTTNNINWMYNNFGSNIWEHIQNKTNFININDRYISFIASKNNVSQTYKLKITPEFVKYMQTETYQNIIKSKNPQKINNLVMLLRENIIEENPNEKRLVSFISNDNIDTLQLI